MQQRLLTAGIGIPLGLLLIYLGGWWLAAAVAALALLGMHEWYRMGGVGNRGVQLAGYLGVLPIIVLAHYLHRYAPVGLAIVGLLALNGIAGARPRGQGQESAEWFRETSAMLFGWAYLPYLFGFLLQLRHLEALRRLPDWLGDNHEGATWLFLVMACCWVIDSAAYFVGRAIGRRKLAPKISPGKTVEGAVGGLVAAVGWCVLVGMLLGLPAKQGLALGAVLGVGGQVGDLFESWLKRRAGVKDSGAMLPGHGGVLDRFDSVLFCAPLAFAFLYWVMRG